MVSSADCNQTNSRELRAFSRWIIVSKHTLADLTHRTGVQDDGKQFNLGELRMLRKLQLHELAHSHNTAAVAPACTTWRGSF